MHHEQRRLCPAGTAKDETGWELRRSAICIEQLGLLSDGCRRDDVCGRKSLAERGLDFGCKRRSGK